MAKNKPKQAAGEPVSEATLAKLEKHYDKIAGLLHCANQQDDQIRQAAIAHHDQVNAQLARIGAKLKLQLPEPDRQLAEQYGQLLKLRSQLQAAIHKGRRPITEQGPTPPL